MLNAMKKNGFILAIFALLATLLVATTNALTKGRIQEQQQQQLANILNQVIPADNHDVPLFSNCVLLNSPQYLGSDQALPAYIATKNGKATGMAIEAIAPDGYNGAIKLMVGLDSNAMVTGVRVLSHNETPGLGDKIDRRVSDWITLFAGKTITDEADPRWAVRKDGGDFDQFTGATITPRAVVAAVKNVTLYFKHQQQTLLTQSPHCQE